jgi:uncharacterized protein
VPYALCGILVLWGARRLPAWALLTGSMVMLGVGAARGFGHALSWESMSGADRAAEAAMMMPTREQATAQLARMFGSYTEVVAANAPSVLMFQTLDFGVFFFWRCSGMMLLGMALYKWGFLDGSRPAGTYLLTAAICLPLGLGLAGFGVTELERVRFAMPERAILDLWNYAGAVLASVGYAAAGILVVKSGALPALRRALAAVGRMAFSNYLFHSVATSVLFLGWGFGLAGRFDYAQQLLVVVAIWVFQLIVSPLWLARFRFGPAEWLWRSLTYGTAQRMRTPAAGAAVN